MVIYYLSERHSTKGNESANMVRKIENGSDWFITQGIYSTTPIIKYY
jgi:5,10-methylenetetrahydrofolate reductase